MIFKNILFDYDQNQSTITARIGYGETAKTLQWEGVSQLVWDELRESPDFWEYFKTNIWDCYPREELI